MAIKGTCIECGEVFDIKLSDQPDFNEKCTMWLNGQVLIEEAWPGATIVELEQLKIGVCSDKCWGTFTKDSEEAGL